MSTNTDTYDKLSHVDKIFLLNNGKQIINIFKKMEEKRDKVRLDELFTLSMCSSIIVITFEELIERINKDDIQHVN